MSARSRTLLMPILLGLLTFACVFLWKKQQIDREHAHQTAFEWFCVEFGVDGARRERIEALHAAHFPECEDHCVHYVDTQETLARIHAEPGHEQSPEHAEAERHRADLEREADKRFIDFVYAVAAEMGPESSDRYLSRMKSWLDRSNSPAGT